MRILVVGGGPAGLSAAKTLANRGHEVILVERGNIGEPVRSSGGIIVEEFRKVYPGVEGLYKTIDRGGFILDTGDVYETSLDGDYMGVLDVRGLYQKLAEEALAAGVTIETHAMAKDIKLGGSGLRAVKVSTLSGDRRVEADFFIDATGASAWLISRIKRKRRRLAVGLEIDTYVTDGRSRIILGDVLKGGYGWVFNRRKTRSRIGVGIIGGGDLTGKLMKTIELWESVTGSTVKGSIEVHSGTFNASGPDKEYRYKNVIAIGDAGGFGSPAYGEGIRFAIESGLMVYKELEEEGALWRYWRNKYGKLYDYGLKAQKVAANLGTRERKKILDTLWPDIEEDSRRLVALMKFDINDPWLKRRLLGLAKDVFGALF